MDLAIVGQPRGWVEVGAGAIEKAVDLLILDDRPTAAGVEELIQRPVRILTGAGRTADRQHGRFDGAALGALQEACRIDKFDRHVEPGIAQLLLDCLNDALVEKGRGRERDRNFASSARLGNKRFSAGRIVGQPHDAICPAEIAGVSIVRRLVLPPRMPSMIPCLSTARAIASRILGLSKGGRFVLSRR